MLKTLKNYQILDLVEAFTKIAETKIKSNKRFSYALVLNDEAIKPFVKAIQEIAAPSESYIEYEQKRNEIIAEYAKVDGDDKIITNQQGGVVFKDGMFDEAKAKLEALNEEHAEILEERTQDIKDYNELLMKDVEINIEEVSLDDVPDAVGEDVFLTKLLVTMIK